MSAITRFKQSVSHGKERKGHQPFYPPPPGPHHARSVLTCIAYVSQSFDSCPWCRTYPLRPWNISFFNAHASSLNILHYTQLSALAITTLDLPSLLAASGVQLS
ncbi:hypothetical protein E2C01_101294 [Portunus trituberculatus]|uniref:Uncharacterized protein n=1 Tax=Portunus trituberculatus TaxID=210409 RepID=A0A5B7KLL4_PORTR|nr:hypothetical protein [Portunus trituberculatus]